MYLLAIDLGTTSVKVSLFDDKTNVIKSCHERVKTNNLPGGYSEQNPVDWLEIIVRNSNKIVSEHKEKTDDIAAIAVTGHMMGCLPVDKKGNPLIGHMLHSDTRAREEVKLLKKQIGSENIYNMTGNVLAGASVLAKMMWLKSKHPDLYDKTNYFLNAKDFINGFLTGCYDKSDFSDASHAGIIDIHKREYPRELYRSLNLDIDKMPRLFAGTDIIGVLCEKTADLLGIKAGIPVVAGAGDGACSAIGAGAGNPGDTYCCMGTTAWIAAIAKEPVLDSEQRSYNIITGDAKAVGSYGTIQNCGRSTDFAQAFFAVEKMKEFDQLAEKAPAGSENLIFLPYIDGERAPVFDPETQGVFFGLSTKHDRSHGLRAVLEGVAFALRQNSDVHRSNGLIVDRVSLIGGGGKSRIWREILASSLPAVITRMDVPSEDATTLGAAILAGTGIGLYSNMQAGIQLIKTVEETMPQTDLVESYNQLYEIYLELYPALKASFARLAAKKN